MGEEAKYHRRHFLSSAAMTMAAARLSMISPDTKPNDSRQPNNDKQGETTSFRSLKQIDAGVLNVGYAEVGASDGPTVILLHGWPYDIYSYVDVAPLLGSKGYRVIIPYLRGYGTTRFLSNETVRNGQPSALALDLIALMDALKIEKAILGGFDWGGAHSQHRSGPLARAC